MSNQEATMEHAEWMAKPQEQHRWLERLVGRWRLTEFNCGPDTPPAADGDWIEVGRSLKGIWVVVEGRGPMPGCGEGETIFTVGYNPKTGKFVGSWAASMMHHLYVYEGEYNSEIDAIELMSEGPSMDDPTKMSTYKDVYAFDGDDKRTLTAFVHNADGSWTQVMTSTYERVK